jgi:creatinine amidohydrolase
VVDREHPDLNFARYSSTGVIGDPTHASAELGAKLWPEVVEAVALTLKAAVEAPADERGTTP